MKLHPSVPHMPGETPGSFASRLAKINGVESGRSLCFDLGVSFEGLLRGDLDAVSAIAEMTDNSAELLLRECRRREGDYYRLRGQVLTPASFVRGSVRVCPACLADDRRAACGKIPDHVAGYGRTIWAVTHIRTCAEHGLVLVDMPVASLAAKYEFVSAVQPLFDGPGSVTVRSRSPSEFEKYLVARLEGRNRDGWLDRLPFYAAARTCEMLGVVNLFGRTPDLKRLSEDDWAAAGRQGYSVASAGPEALDDMLGRFWRDYPGSRATPNGPQAWFGRLYQWLEFQTKDDAFTPLRDLMVRSVAERAAFHPNERMFGKPVPYRKVHSLRTAAHVTKLSAKRLRKVLDRAGHLGLGHGKLADHEVTFDACAASDLLERLTNAMTLTEVAARLGVSWAHAAQIVAAGYLRPMQTDASGTASTYFTAAETEAFLRSLHDGAPIVSAAPAGACGLPYAAQRAKCRLVELVGFVLAKEIRCVGRFSSPDGLSSVLVDLDAVRAHVRRPELGGYTRRHVELILGISTRAVNALVEKGVLKTTIQRHPSVPRDVMVIPIDELDRFRARYGKLTEVAAELGLTHQALQKFLNASGIEPVLPKSEFHASFYDRKCVGEIKQAIAEARGV